MKLTVQQDPAITETEITIRCALLTPELEALVRRVRQMDATLTGRKEGRLFRIPADKLLYIDSVDGRTFLYGAGDCYESDDRLFALEEKLRPLSFLRISKNAIVNLRYLESARPAELSRMELTLKNGERLMVSRHYMDSFKQAFCI